MVALQGIPFMIVGLTLAVCSFYFLRLSSNIAEPPKQSFLQKIKSFSSQPTCINSTVYNESFHIDGDYVQGNKSVFNNFNFDQDVFSAIDEIKKIIKRTEKHMGSIANAQGRIINDLAVIVSQNSELRDNLYDWLDTLGFTCVKTEVDAAEKIIEISASLNSKYYKQSIIQLDRRYRRLKYLLKTGQWREADEETVRVTQAWMPGSSPRNRCTDIIVDEIPIKQLRMINKLWVEASGGRFGFSVQKEIWLKIKKIYQYGGRFGLSKSEYDLFVEAVGWSSGENRIYHVEFDYLITNPRGHLPVKILLLENLSSNSNYCSLSTCLFDDFMDRPYSNVSFLPAWLRRYLLLD